ncbi:hypothetical protein PHJA_000217200 [Phtheirospermum japonicum]|uniref:KIB1-4 beta-propeller domain-containing protein n=1 Tax=Phtheirospermum japonicum TaxID=374723 RepID=A0A830B610_9LAMI|nr:hypothetical protein PHJA_000217200 [Phtheirospermum japonicum]
MAYSLARRRYSVVSSIFARIANSFDCSCNLGHRRRRMSALNSAPSKITPPWLMLPPALKGGGGDMVYRFYNLAEGRVESLPKRRSSSGSKGKSESESELPGDECKFVGSSHGWLVLFNPRNYGLFLSNPITRRHIKLPSIQTLPDPNINFHGIVSKVILSCSPDEEDEEDECRALMIFGPEDRLAFCQPRRSTKWTPIGNLYYDDWDCKPPWRYMDIVYSSRQKLLFCLAAFGVLECWDLRDPKMIPRICWWDRLGYLNDEAGALDENRINRSVGGQADVIIHLCLVFAEQSNQLFIVKRRVSSRMSPDGSYPIPIYFSKYRGWDNNKFPYQTIGFDVNKVDWNIDEEGEQKVKFKYTYMKSSLGDAAMFLGMNHSFAITAVDEYPELKLKPDCIYFADTNRHPRPAGSFYGGHDIGIFHYGNRIFSPCFYPWEVDKIKRIVPAPMWFTPSPSTLHKYSD